MPFAAGVTVEDTSSQPCKAISLAAVSNASAMATALGAYSTTIAL